jgi:hypothetical protein
MNKRALFGGIVLLSLAAGGLFGLYNLISSTLPPEIRLPLLAIAGVTALLITLALVAGAFSLFNLSNQKEALGLPEGSVRAVIALSLIVLFAILSIYLYSDMNREQIKEIGGLSEAQKAEILKAVPGGKIVATISNGQTGDAQQFTVVYRANNAASEDFAKQLLVMIGTLVTSVASFYFGTKAASAPMDAATKSKPMLRNISPKSQTRGSMFDAEVSGDNLDLIKEVKVVNGARQILAANVTSNASLVKCQLNLPLTEPAGAWTVVVTDGLGQKAELPDALTMT